MHSRAWRYWVPCYVMTAWLALVGLLLALIIYRAGSWRMRDGLLTCVAGTFDRDGRKITRIWGRPGAQTFAWVQIYASEHHRSDTPLRVHETTHTIQVFLLALGAHAIVPVLFALGDRAVLGLALSGPIGTAAFALSYGVAFLYFYLRAPRLGWRPAYEANPYEQWADAQQLAWIKKPDPNAWGSR